MTVKEYLSQGYRLENRIRLVQEEIEQLNELAVSISAVGYGEKYSAGRNTASPFERVLLKIMEMQEQESCMLEELLAFKKELKEIIDGIENKDERLVMHYRYLCDMKWTQIADRLEWDARTIKRWHSKAAAKISLPENPTVIDKNLLKN